MDKDVENPEKMMSEEKLGFFDYFHHETIFNLIGIENNGDPTFWIWVAIFYIVLFLPCWIVVRAALFFILPKSWLKWMFKI